MPQALLGNRPHPNMLLFAEAFSAEARPVMKAFRTVSVVNAKKNCIHWKLSTTFFFTIPADMRDQILFGWESGSKHSHLLGFFVAYRHTLSDVNSCQIINSAVQRSGGGVESGDMTSRTCEQVWQGALALFGYTHFMRCMVGAKWWE